MLPSNDILETIVSEAKHRADHKPLVEAFRSKTVLDTLRFSAFRDGFLWQRSHCLVIDEQGRGLGALHEWLPPQLEAAGGDPVKVWEAHRDGPLRLVNSRITKLLFAAPYGDAAHEYVQIEVSRHARYIESRLFSRSPHDKPRRPEDLLDNFGFYESRFSVADERPWGEPLYAFDRAFDLAAVLQTVDELDAESKARNERLVIITKTADSRQAELQRRPYFEAFPDQRDLLPPARRLFRDWDRSSAGISGARFCDHWFVDYSTWTDARSGRRSISVIPQWATRRKMPKIVRAKNQTVFGLYDKLLKFDEKAGYPFAWYFFMLHGNRIEDWVGEWIFRSAAAGDIPLPDHDRLILQEWEEHRFGF